MSRQRYIRHECLTNNPDLRISTQVVTSREQGRCGSIVDRNPASLHPATKSPKKAFRTKPTERRILYHQLESQLRRSTQVTDQPEKAYLQTCSSGQGQMPLNAQLQHQCSGRCTALQLARDPKRWTCSSETVLCKRIMFDIECWYICRHT